MKYIGAHVSAEGGVSNAPIEAAELGATAFALFTRVPSRWKSPEISQAEAEKFKENCARLGFQPAHILPHDSFLINLGSPDKQKLHLSKVAFLDEMKRCEQLGLTMLNFHPGSHMGEMDQDACLKLIAENINRTLEQTMGVKAVIETTAGQGTNLGHEFEQIATIIHHIEDKSRVGVCVDTCHSFVAGYDMTTPETYEETWKKFDSIIGFNYLSGMHLNDAKKGLGSRIDRHEVIGQGNLGNVFFEMLMKDPRMDNIPLILETPDPLLWQQEIAWLFSVSNS